MLVELVACLPAAFNLELEVLQRDFYYPFGLSMEGAWIAGSTDDPRMDYRYNGKELSQVTGLMDYGARYYDPAIGRFTGVDPLAEEYAAISPYAYVANNPLLYIDPDGMSIESTYKVGQDGRITKIDDKKYYDSKGNEVDLLASGSKVKYNKKGEVRNNNIYVKKGVLKQLSKVRKVDIPNTIGKKTHEQKYSMASLGYDVEQGTKVFEFLANNSSVEWSLTNYNYGENTLTDLITSYEHDQEIVGATFANKRKKELNFHYHSHPTTYQMGDESRLKPSVQDRDFVKKIKSANKSATFKIYFNYNYISY